MKKTCPALRGSSFLAAFDFSPGGKMLVLFVSEGRTFLTPSFGRSYAEYVESSRQREMLSWQGCMPFMAIIMPFTEETGFSRKGSCRVIGGGGGVGGVLSKFARSPYVWPSMMSECGPSLKGLVHFTSRRDSPGNYSISGNCLWFPPCLPSSFLRKPLNGIFFFFFLKHSIVQHLVQGLWKMDLCSKAWAVDLAPFWMRQPVIPVLGITVLFCSFTHSTIFSFFFSLQ